MSSDRHHDLLRRRATAVPRGPFNVAPIFVERALGATVWDVDGRAYIDFCGGIGVLNVGHNHPSVVAAIKAQADKLIHTCWHVAMYEPYLELAERLTTLVPTVGPVATVFLNSGAEAVENAVKIARAATGRPAVVAFERGYHGRTLLGLSLTGKVAPYCLGFGPFAPEVYRLPFEPFFGPEPAADPSEVEAAVRRAFDRLFAYHVDADSVACVVVEPVLGEGGFLPIREAAFAVLREVCTARGILLIADEVQSGFGRCGAWFACERYDVAPDLVVMAKSLGGGLPLSAVSGSSPVMNAPAVGGLGGTYGGNPLACAAALAVLDVIVAEDLLARAEIIGERVRATFGDLAGRHSFLDRPRGLGAMRGIAVIDPDRGTPDPARAARLVAAARDRGLLLMLASGHVVRTLMPLVITDPQLEEGLGRFESAVKAVA